MNRKILIKGFTLTETLIAIAIMLTLTFIVLSVFTNFRNHESLEKDAGLVVEVIRQAKNLTTNSKNSTEYGVHINSGDITLFTGTSYSAGSTTNQVYIFNGGVTATTSLSGGGSNIIFKRLSGQTDNNGTITLSSSFSTTTKTINVYKTGLAE